MGNFFAPQSDAVATPLGEIPVDRDWLDRLALIAPEQAWNLATTLSYLSQKAGLSSDAWREGAKFETFQAEVFHE